MNDLKWSLILIFLIQNLRQLQPGLEIRLAGACLPACCNECDIWNLSQYYSQFIRMIRSWGSEREQKLPSLFFPIEYCKIQSQLYFSCPRIDDVLIICKSIIPHNRADFYIIKFNTCSASICLAQSHPHLNYPPHRRLHNSRLPLLVTIGAKAWNQHFLF